MISVLVLTHGDLATELLTAAREIDTELAEGTAALALAWDVDSDEGSSQVKKAVREVDCGKGVIVLTDMFGGTPSNLAISITDDDGIEALAGINLPMLVKLASARREESLKKVVITAQDAGRKYIHAASALLDEAS